ncbi:MAG: hypothetical protein WCK54_16950 [Desulfuromonadales bacterium]
MLLLSDFPECFSILQNLFGTQLIHQNINRLNAIHSHTEDIWRSYVEMIPKQTGIRYLLIAEAPPWSLDGRPNFVLDPQTPPSVMMNAICRAFFGRLIYNQIGLVGTLQLLAQQGFLIIDSLPFAMNYQGRRNRASYSQLVAMSCGGYFQEKIMYPQLVYSAEVKIAFAFKLNGLATIKSLGGNILLGGRDYGVNGGLIVANAAGFPDGNLLNHVFGL